MAQKTPTDWETLCTNTFLWLVYWIKKYEVPVKLVIKGDQIGVAILPAGKETWAECGAKQVASVAKEEKRQYMLMVGSSASGDMIPFQAIWSGKTDKSLFVPRVQGAAEKQRSRVIVGYPEGGMLEHPSNYKESRSETDNPRALCTDWSNLVGD